MSVKLLTEHHLEFLGCTGLPEPTLVKIPHCWKSHGGLNYIFNQSGKSVNPDQMALSDVLVYIPFLV